MKLLYSPASPYSAKVRMAARHLGIGITEVKTDTNAAPPELVSNNPLGKIPVLLRDGEPPIYDSIAIMHWLDRQSGGKLYPKKDAKRTEAEVLEALCDGITDCLLAIVYERRSRDEDKVHQPWIDKQWAKVVRGLDHLENNLPKTGKKLHGGHFALAALIGYLDLRFNGQWAAGRPELASWPDVFTKRFASYTAMKSAA
ncbi:Glutathione S-transferase domain protein [Neorhizobium galegae bv. officinalis bv. officinalis str. HAMBI 1141]|uniref:Glutathione S-transferase domain protein n=1 Tax=Neorhizobium galegae bv. officinalis bv. officinalis str. HAMBI 1141 TaxID=1028801 RepID=A0A068T4J6_NEOGA|nr:glutathione S-transferase [Neorhizobium galegae]CDN53417.1 Glutathione S-transferase domain protein [Neorhizobium galegae bv. officinalis bv. officinalis str. HAMBI 1141]